MISLFSAPRLTLSDDEVHVWYLRAHPTSHASYAAVAKPLLDEVEQRRAAAFSHWPSQFEFVVGRAFLRWTLGRYLSVEPASLHFQPNQYGRPELIGGSKLQFNLSHSGGLIALAIAYGHEVGLDVEHSRAHPLDAEVAEEHFAPSEFADYASQSTPAARHTRFLEYWTLKEAYLKARGTGLALPLHRFSCTWTDPRQVQLTIHPAVSPDATWQLSLLQPPPDFTASLAVRITLGRQLQIVERVLGLEKLFAPPLAATG